MASKAKPKQIRKMKFKVINGLINDFQEKLGKFTKNKKIIDIKYTVTHIKGNHTQLNYSALMPHH